MSRSLSSGAHSRDPLAHAGYGAPAYFAAKNTSPSSDEFDHGTCLFLVVATTSARTRVSICCTSMPVVPMWRDSAAENGLLAPSPSSATCPGAVANAISVPAPRVAPEPSEVGAARPEEPASMSRAGPVEATFGPIGLLRQASRIRMLVRT